MKNNLLLVFVALVCVVSVAYSGTITPSSNDAVDIYQLRKEIVRAVNNKSFAAAGLKFNAGDATKLETVNTVTTMHTGVPNSVAAVATFAFSAATPVIPTGKRAYISVGVNSSDVFSTVHGSPVTYDHELVIPLLPEGIAPVGLVKIISVAADFTPNTTALNSSSHTVTISDMLSVPLSLDMKQR